jgi:hypothetical protein
MAQLLLSTSPASEPRLLHRVEGQVGSNTPEAFFGQRNPEPACRRRARRTSGRKGTRQLALRVAKTTATSNSPRTRGVTPSSSAKPSGAAC